MSDARLDAVQVAALIGDVAPAGTDGGARLLRFLGGRVAFAGLPAPSPDGTWSRREVEARLAAPGARARIASSLTSLARSHVGVDLRVGEVRFQ